MTGRDDKGSGKRLLDHLKEYFEYSIESTADWRRRKAAEYPDDERNAQAAAALERLHAYVYELPADGGSPGLDRYLKAQAHIIANKDERSDRMIQRATEIESEYLGDIYVTGISLTPEGFEAFLERLAEAIESEIFEIKHEKA